MGPARVPHSIAFSVIEWGNSANVPQTLANEGIVNNTVE